MKLSIIPEEATGRFKKNRPYLFGEEKEKEGRSRKRVQRLLILLLKKGKPYQQTPRKRTTRGKSKKNEILFCPLGEEKKGEKNNLYSLTEEENKRQSAHVIFRI